MNARGFSLIEILVVLAIIGILAAVVRFSFTGADSRQALAAAAEGLAAQVEIARSESLQANREFGFRLHDRRVEFVEFDVEASRWQLVADGPLLPRRLPDQIELELEADGFDHQAVASVFGRDEEAEDIENDQDGNESGHAGRHRIAAGDGDEPQPVPDVLLLSNGEATPFELKLLPPGDASGWSVKCDGLSRTTAGVSQDAQE